MIISAGEDAVRQGLDLPTDTKPSQARRAVFHLPATVADTLEPWTQHRQLTSQRLDNPTMLRQRSPQHYGSGVPLDFPPPAGHVAYAACVEARSLSWACRCSHSTGNR